LFEHPQICMPRKEVNFFSRERNWSRGFDWYEDIFAECPPTGLRGEFSTSYLTDGNTPARIRQRYPQARVIVSLRHPVDRAYSNYLNDIVAGQVPAAVGFAEALQSHPEYIEGGRYARYLRTYLDLFGREQLLVSLFDDVSHDPGAAIARTYRFLGVDAGFRPTMLDRRVGVGRVPRLQWLDRVLIDTAAWFRRRRVLRPLWWQAKRLGVGDRVRALNTAPSGGEDGLDPEQRRSLIEEFEPDNEALETLLGVQLPGWRQ
jgi:hypothetical protein